LADIRHDPKRERFLIELCKALRHLYDPAVLERSPLIALFGLDKRAHPHAALRRLIIDAVQHLKPEDTVPFHASAWRIYHVLAYRYIEQSDQRTVALNLGLSIRQLRRQERLAEHVLADYLWKEYDVEAKAQNTQAPSSPMGTLASSEEGKTTSDQEEELTWLRQSLPSETTQVAEFIQNVLRVAKPMLSRSAVEVQCQIPDGFPPLTGQLLLLRQAFLNLLTLSARSAPQGRVHITAEVSLPVLYIHFRAAVDQAPSAIHQNDNIHQWKERSEIARRLVKAFGGDLKVTFKPTERESITAQFALPIGERRIRVLVIDDNADALLLFERYFSGTRYEFAGVRDPEQALAMAQTLSPQIIVLDVMLPGIDGWELLGRLREHPLTRHVPVVVCTILPQEELAQALGAAAFIRKPVSREMLLSVLGQQITSLG
jgi:CheY-like chemotaxis protein